MDNQKEVPNLNPINDQIDSPMGGNSTTLPENMTLEQSNPNKFRQLFKLNALGRLVLVALSVTAVALGTNYVRNADASNLPSGPTVSVIETTQDLSKKLTVQPSLIFSKEKTNSGDVITVNDNIKYQKMDGFGAAMTDSSTYLINSLSKTKENSLMQDLFSKSGIDISYVRLPLGASDFTAKETPYTYDDLPAGETDPNLVHFSIAHDAKYTIPVLKKMLAIDPNVKVIATEWSPPAWMKVNDNLNFAPDISNPSANESSFNDGLINTPWIYQTLANYLTKATIEYKQNGINFYALAPQNEPFSATSYPSLWLPESQQQNLIPLLSQDLKNNGLQTLVYGNDASYSQYQNADTLASTLNSSSMYGIDWHCYGGNINEMTQTHNEFPAYNEIVDECSPEMRQETTSSEIISASRNYASAFMLWNMALNASGGPVQPPDKGCPDCSGVTTINNGNFSFANKYYELGQFTKYVLPGAYRIGSNTFVSYSTNTIDWPTVGKGIDDVAYENPDGEKVLVVTNTGAQRGFDIKWDGMVVSDVIPADATMTLKWR